MMPWFQFLSAEGDSEEVRIAFASHDVLVKGAGLESLLSDLASQRIAELREPSRPDHFKNTTAPNIREITVTKIEEQI